MAEQEGEIVQVEATTEVVQPEAELPVEVCSSCLRRSSVACTSGLLIGAALQCPAREAVLAGMLPIPRVPHFSPLAQPTNAGHSVAGGECARYGAARRG